MNVSLFVLWLFYIKIGSIISTVTLFTIDIIELYERTYIIFFIDGNFLILLNIRQLTLLFLFHYYLLYKLFWDRKG